MATDFPCFTFCMEYRNRFHQFDESLVTLKIYPLETKITEQFTEVGVVLGYFAMQYHYHAIVTVW